MDLHRNINAETGEKHGLLTCFVMYRILWQFDSRIQNKACALREAEWPQEKIDWVPADSNCWISHTAFLKSIKKKEIVFWIQNKILLLNITL